MEIKDAALHANCFCSPSHHTAWSELVPGLIFGVTSNLTNLIVMNFNNIKLIIY